MLENGAVLKATDFDSMRFEEESPRMAGLAGDL